MESEDKPFSHLLDLTSDPAKINDVFPLVQSKQTTRQRTPSPKNNFHSPTPQVTNLINDLQIDDEDDLQGQSRRNTIANRAKQSNQRFFAPAYTRRDTMPSKHAPTSPKLREPSTAISLDQAGSIEKPTTSSTLSLKQQSQKSVGSFLVVDQQQFLERAQSADMLFLKSDVDEDDLRRASFDTTHSTSVMQTNGSGLHLSVYGRRPGTGRKLPSTEMLEQKHHQNVQLQHRSNQFVDVPQIVAPPINTLQGSNTPVSPRRGSFLLCRTPAIEAEINAPPRKQNSSPLPRAHIYEPGHEFSRSWNSPDVYGPSNTSRYGRRVVDTQIDYVRNEHQPLNSAYQQSSSSINNYNSANSTNFTDFYRPQQAQVVRYAIIQNKPSAHAQLISTPHMLSLPLFQRQTKSVDQWDNGSGVRNAVIEQNVPRFGPPSPLLERRTVSESAERHLMRQHTVQHCLHPSNELSRQCQSLWHKRENLTSGVSIPIHNRGPFASADFSDTATSFESNDTGNGVETNEESEKRAVPSPAQAAFAGRPSFKLRRPTTADKRRQEYRSLLIQRQIAASTLATSMSPISPMSPSNKNISRTIAQNQQISSSVEDDEEDVGNLSDSAQSSFNIFASSIESSEMSAATTDRPCPRGVSRSTSVALRQMTTARQARFQQNGARSYDMKNRDFSVDSRSDSIFRDFVRVDPRFESLRQSNDPRIQQQPQFIERERAPTLPSRFRSPSQKPPNFNFSNSFASSGLRTSHYERQRTAPFYQSAMQTHHQSLIRR